MAVFQVNWMNNFRGNFLMHFQKPFQGLMAAPHTPMKENGDIHFDQVHLQADHLVKTGVRGAFVCGTTGECQSLTIQERKQLAEAWVSANAGRLVLNVHVGTNSARESAELARHAQKIGADAFSASAPCFFKPASNQELVEYQAEVASGAPDLPFYHYHIPVFSGYSQPVAPFLKIASGKIPNLVGVKYSNPDLADLLACRTGENSRFEVLFGCDEMLLGALAMGVRGAVGSTYNLAANWYLEMMAAVTNGNLALAQGMQQRSVALVRLMNEHGGIASSKAMMGALGVECGPVRTPLRRLTDEQVETLRDKFMMLASMASTVTV
jgi:N-acetylneuraminate lyase